MRTTALLAMTAAVACLPSIAVARTTPDPLAALPFYVAKSSQAAIAERTYRRRRERTDARLMARIADHSQAIWLTGDRYDLSTLRKTVQAASAARRLPTFVLYDIPHRDCGSYSSGGARSASAYRAWVRRIAAGLGSTPVAVIVEPDALAELSCWSRRTQRTNVPLVRYAAVTLAQRPRTTVYIDAGNSAWEPVSMMAGRLRRAGIAEVRGFALNVSNFQTNQSTIAYGTRLSRAVGRKHFVIDTSRNGRGPRIVRGVTEWCNPPGRALGHYPTADTGSPLVDAFLWIKTPGQSDGSCHGGPRSGLWWPAYALGLARRAR